MKWDAVVIGSGMAGLACAGLLALHGRSVVVLEQASVPGGYLTSFHRRGFTFDAAVDCIAGLDDDGLVMWLLRALGVGERLAPIRLDPIRVTRFPGLTVPVDADLPSYMDRLCRLFPAERAGLDAFFKRAEDMYGDVARLMAAVREPVKEVPPLPGALLRYGQLTYAQLLGLDVRNPRLIALLSDRCPFLGVSPARAAATRMVTLIMSYFRSGAFRTRGGHQQIPNLLVEGIQTQGGEVHLGRAATKIAVSGDRCTGVLTKDGGNFVGRHVVSTADFRVTFGELIGGRVGQAMVAENGARPVSPSFFIAYAGIRRDAIPSASSIGSFDSFDLEGLLGTYAPFSATDPLGVTIPTVEDAALAPAGHDVVLVHELVPTSYLCEWERTKQMHLERLLRKTERVVPGLMDRLVYCEAATPETLERFTRNHRGAAYGWEQVPYLPRVRHGIRNLHLAGHWADNGGGVLAAVYSGMRAAARILRGTV